MHVFCLFVFSAFLCIPYPYILCTYILETGSIFFLAHFACHDIFVVKNLCKCLHIYLFVCLFITIVL